MDGVHAGRKAQGGVWEYDGAGAGEAPLPNATMASNWGANRARALPQA